MLVRRGEYTAEPLSGWDTLGFRGTCSSGFTLTAEGDAEQILPTPFADILAQTMHPYSHIVWGRCGRASRPTRSTGPGPSCAPRRARRRARRRCRPCAWPRSISVLQEMRHNVAGLTREYQRAARRATARGVQRLRLRHPHQQPQALQFAADRRHRRPGAC